MQLRSQKAMIIDLSRCLSCRACSMACKKAWTERRGLETAWWHQVEERPGPGFPTSRREPGLDPGGWQLRKGQLRLNPSLSLSRLFHDPALPVLDDYYDPWNSTRTSLLGSEDQALLPARNFHSAVSGESLRPKVPAGWQPSRGGKSDLPSDEETELFRFSLPRLCNHCLYPSCVARCPSRALYKRGEDGIVLVDRKVCRGWRSCIAACPYKAVHFDWIESKAVKCHFCYPLVEQGKQPVCVESCPGSISRTGTLLYDSDRLQEVAESNDVDLLDQFRSLFQDPERETVRREAGRAGIQERILAGPEQKIFYQLISEWRVALPLHLEYRTLPAVFYLPPVPVSGAPLPRNAILQLAHFLSMGNPAPTLEAAERLSAIRRFSLALSRRSGVDSASEQLRKRNLTEEAATAVEAWRGGDA